MLAGVAAEIRTKDPTNTSVQLHGGNNRFGDHVLLRRLKRVKVTELFRNELTD
jgi:hypothetical protein